MRRCKTHRLSFSYLCIVQCSTQPRDIQQRITSCGCMRQEPFETCSYVALKSDGILIADAKKYRSGQEVWEGRKQRGKQQSFFVCMQHTIFKYNSNFTLSLRTTAFGGWQEKFFVWLKILLDQATNSYKIATKKRQRQRQNLVIHFFVVCKHFRMLCFAEGSSEWKKVEFLTPAQLKPMNKQSECFFIRGFWIITVNRCRERAEEPRNPIENCAILLFEPLVNRKESNKRYWKWEEKRNKLFVRELSLSWLWLDGEFFGVAPAVQIVESRHSCAVKIYSWIFDKFHPKEVEAKSFIWKHIDFSQCREVL